MLSVASHHDRASLYGVILNKQHPMIQEWRACGGLHALAEEGHLSAALSFWALSSAVCAASSLHALLEGGASRAGAGDIANCGACFCLQEPRMHAMKSTGKASVLSTMTTMRSLNTTCASHSAFCRATVAERRKDASCAPPPSRAYRQKWSPSRFKSAKKHVEHS